VENHVVSFKRYNHLFLFFSESFVLGLLWGVFAVPDLEMLSSLRRLLCKKEEMGKRLSVQEKTNSENDSADCSHWPDSVY